MVAMIEATFRAAPMPMTRRGDRAASADPATHGGAIRMAAIARRADREETMAATAGFLAKGCVHSVGAAAVRSNWTYSPNRGTTGRTASACRSPRQSRGSGGSVRALTPACSAYAIARPRDREEAVDAAGPMDARTRPQVLAKPRRRGFARAPTAILDILITRPDRKTRREKFRFLRFYVAGDTAETARRERAAQSGAGRVRRHHRRVRRPTQPRPDGRFGPRRR